MKKIIAEFKTFISRGNVMDMAVGIVMGTAFTAIVTALVQGVVMPCVGYLIKGVNFADLKWVLTPAVGDAPEVAVLYGAFIQQIINFLIIAIVVFSIVKVLNRLRKKKEDEKVTEEPPKPTTEETLLTEIRDLLKEKN